MKSISKLSFFAILFTLLAVQSCTKEEVTPRIDGGVPVVKDKI